MDADNINSQWWTWKNPDKPFDNHATVNVGIEGYRKGSLENWTAGGRRSGEQRSLPALPYAKGNRHAEPCAKASWLRRREDRLDSSRFVTSGASNPAQTPSRPESQRFG